MSKSDEVAINILSSQEEEELRLQNELNNAYFKCRLC